MRLSIHTLPVNRMGPSAVGMRNTTVRLSRVSGTFLSVESLTVHDAFHALGSPFTSTAYTLSSTLTLYVPARSNGWRSRIGVACPATQCSTMWVPWANNGPSVTNTLATRPCFNDPN